MNQNPPTLDGVKAKFQRAEQRVGKVPFWTKFAQGFSALPGQHKEWAFNTLLLLYYSQVLGLPASTASIVLAISLVFDAISDPMAGAFSDSYRSRFGRRHALMLMSILPSWRDVCLIRTARRPEHCGARGLAASKYRNFAGEFLFRFAVPWGAIAAELSEDYDERTVIIAYRMLIGLVGGGLFIFFIYDAFPSIGKFRKRFILIREIINPLP